MPQFYTPKQVAEMLVVTVDKVTDWIANGDLAAVNVSKLRGVRARWRISREALEQFLASRGNRMAPEPAPRAKRQKSENATTYF